MSKLYQSAKGVFILSNFQIISQHVDTLKFHYYIASSISDESFHDYNKKVNEMIALKKEAQQAKNDYGDIKSIKKHFSNDYDFNIMPTSISGFSVVIFNNDISIALRKSKNKVNNSPILKVEFRAEFLARKGYRKCIDIVNDFVSSYLVDDTKVKISEIHLATDIQGYDFTPLDFYRMKTRSRNSQTHEEETDYSKASSYGGLTTFSGFSFGGGDYHLRIYNKTLEINKFKNKAFAKSLLWANKSNFDDESKVWRIEIQIRRAKLKKMVNSDNSSMDDYANILNGIPSLWAKAMQDFSIKDISDMQTFDLLRGYRTLKNGKDKPLTKSAIYGIFKRSDNLPFWSVLGKWNHYEGAEINTAFNIPMSGSEEYVFNSIKSLYSTMGKHYGSVTAKTLLTAFADANARNVEKKQVSLLEDSFNKQIDWFERIDLMHSTGVLNIPEYKHLESEIYQTLVECDTHIKDTSFSHEIIDRIEARANFAASENSVIHVRDVDYLKKLINKVEKNVSF